MALLIRQTLNQFEDEWGIEVRDPDDVQDVLSQSSDTLRYLTPLCAAARAEFPEPAELSLEVVSDPEALDRRLVLFVRMDPYTVDVMDRADRVWGQQFGADQMVTAGIPFMTDFQLPGRVNGVRVGGVPRAR